jgi:hypothetical protein
MQESSNFKFPFAVLVLLLLLTACGRVGPPQPPFIRIPEAVNDLAVTQAGHELVLTWTNPPRYIDGSPASNLARAHIRSNGELLATVNVNAAGQAQSYAMPADLRSRGERTFNIVVETLQAKLSETSNTASITPVEVPGRIAGLRGWVDQRRIFLDWDSPADHPELADGYIVARTDVPAEPETVTDTRYEDIRYQPGKPLAYNITPVRRVAGTVVLGVGPEPVLVAAEDKTPPAAPAGLEFTQEVLTWEQNSEIDLEGYRVFRSDRPDGGFKEISDRVIMTNRFSDPEYRSGLYYVVIALDDSGNPSGMSMPARAP